MRILVSEFIMFSSIKLCFRVKRIHLNGNQGRDHLRNCRRNGEEIDYKIWMCKHK